MKTSTGLSAVILELVVEHAYHTSVSAPKDLEEIRSRIIWYILLTKMSSTPVFIPKYTIAAYTTFIVVYAIRTEAVHLEQNPDVKGTLYYKPSIYNDTHTIHQAGLEKRQSRKLEHD